METCSVSPKDSGETVAGTKDINDDQALSVINDFLGKGSSCIQGVSWLYLYREYVLSYVSAYQYI